MRARFFRLEDAASSAPDDDFFLPPTPFCAEFLRQLNWARASYAKGRWRNAYAFPVSFSSGFNATIEEVSLRHVQPIEKKEISKMKEGLSKWDSILFWPGNMKMLLCCIMMATKEKRLRTAIKHV